ncbi:hypothetical protein LEP1GSC171_0370 [Leptospira santarosai str. HAI1380]|nr:hypothetical protein LEP1GSC005_0385 [Leptospira santarosai str. ST188]EMM76839.1 hypothetical protein LEP1GSC040_0883 [Leptospira santarosai str. 2000030832]EMM86730.1 hypothetical protein LEP1GSC039_3772 [Leptospira santarosai str. 2000027870]EMP01898.1 hypothetical protein LEP1GSC171_0370 [Leptospira santarosai str. HAI1380]
MRILEFTHIPVSEKRSLGTYFTTNDFKSGKDSEEQTERKRIFSLVRRNLIRSSV